MKGIFGIDLRATLQVANFVVNIYPGFSPWALCGWAFSPSADIPMVELNDAH